MAKLTEAEARRVCEALGEDPDRKHHAYASKWPGFPTTPNPLGLEDFALVPAWRIAQRAAEEGGEK